MQKRALTSKVTTSYEKVNDSEMPKVEILVNAIKERAKAEHKDVSVKFNNAPDGTTIDIVKDNILFKIWKDSKKDGLFKWNIN